MTTFVLAWIVTYLLHSTLLVLGAWLLDKHWHDRPERMSAVWKTALVGGLLTATVQTGMGVAPVTGQWELLSTPVVAEASPPSSAPAVIESPAMVSSVTITRPTAEAESVIVIESVPEPVDVVPMTAHASWPPPGEFDALPFAGTTTMSEGTSSAVGSTWLPRLVPWIVGLVALIAALGLASVLAALVTLRHQLRGRRPVVDGSLRGLLDELRLRAAIRRRVPLTVASQVSVPMAVGVWRPEIVVPPAVTAELSLAHQQSLLAHELAHVLRWDPAWRLVALLVKRVMFMQPLNHLAAAKLAQTAEYLCDDWAARHTRQPLELARCLTEIATWVAQPEPVAATMSGPRSILGRRVHRLLQPVGERSRPRWLWAALGLPLMAMVFAAPGVSAHAGSSAERPEIDEPSARVVVLDDASSTAFASRDGDVIVLRDEDGALVVESVESEGSTRARRRRTRKAERRRDKDIAKARRTARREVRRAFREAKRDGEAAPSRRELEAILRRAREAEGPRHRRGVATRGGPESFELRVVTPEGAVEIRAEVPAEALEALEALEGLEALEALEVLGDGELGPMLEVIEGDVMQELEELERELKDEHGVEIHFDGPHARSEHRRQVEARTQQRESARARVEAHRAQVEAHRAQVGVHRAQVENMRAAQRRVHERQRLDAQELRRIEREVEKFERRIRREHERRAQPAPPSPGELPVVRRATPGPEAGVRRGPRTPRPAFPSRVAPPAPPRAPAAPLPPARRAPQAPDSSVVWVSSRVAPVPAPPAPPAPVVVIGPG